MPVPGLTLPRMLRRIYEAVKRHPGITPARLRDIVWADDPDGGPLDISTCLSVQIINLNARLKPHGIEVRSATKKPGTTYRIVALEETA
jgi:hypothetical protein